MIESVAAYYHATTIPMATGERGPKPYAPSFASERQMVEDFLESRRPATAVSRVTSWFACDAPGEAAIYLENESPLSHPVRGRWLYAVKLERFSRQPMVIVEYIRRCLAKGEMTSAETFASEYWNPSGEWSFYEYTAEEIVVCGEVEWPDDIERTRAHLSYQRDQHRAKAMLSSNPSPKF